MDERKVQQPNRTRLQQGDFARTLHVVTAHENTTPEDLLDPSYWAHISSFFKPNDRIEVRADDGAWFAELLVLDCSRQWAKVHLLSKHKLTTADVSQTQADLANGYEIKWRGPHLKHSVIRVADAMPVKEGCATRDEAAGWLREHLKAIG